MSYDYVVVGAGLTGATIARLLTDAGHSVIVYERGERPGGNCSDVRHASGVYVGLHGPHYFRTNSAYIWDFVTRFSVWYNCRARVLTAVGGKLESWPLRRQQVLAVDPNWEPAKSWALPLNFEQAVLRQVPEAIYERFIKGYTEKQWGVSPGDLDTSLATRIDIRDDDLPEFKTHTYQGIPVDGYTNFITDILTGIDVHYNCFWFRGCGLEKPRHRTFYTGPIDEYYSWSRGHLQYRTQQRLTCYLEDTEYVQDAGQVNYPDLCVPFIRTIEWKYLMPRPVRDDIKGTVLTVEIPRTAKKSVDFEYPFPDAHNRKRYDAYLTMSFKDEGTVFAGRLGTYRYFDMDQAIGHAHALVGRELKGKSSRV